ncbi:MAG TPA: hypothetical protein VK211_29720 [Kamptonema sp.]|nr:hypothetical protein [Kamptonema sp.]
MDRERKRSPMGWQKAHSQDRTLLSAVCTASAIASFPRIGVPAVAASSIICANTLVSPTQTAQCL